MKRFIFIATGMSAMLNCRHIIMFSFLLCCIDASIWSSKSNVVMWGVFFDEPLKCDFQTKDQIHLLQLWLLALFAFSYRIRVTSKKLKCVSHILFNIQALKWAKQCNHYFIKWAFSVHFLSLKKKKPLDFLCMSKSDY